MKPVVPPAAPAPLTTDKAERIKHLPPEARAAFLQFEKEGNASLLDPVIFAILNDFIPRPPAKPLPELPDTTLLIEDLGFDSLAITEVVFFTEDLFEITITNEEVIQVRTLGDLKNFIVSKVAPSASR